MDKEDSLVEMLREARLWARKLAGTSDGYSGVCYDGSAAAGSLDPNNMPEWLYHPETEEEKRYLNILADMTGVYHGGST